MQITINVAAYPSESLRKLAYALASAGPEMQHRKDRMITYRQLLSVTTELENRANGGDTSELRDMIAHWARSASFPLVRHGSEIG